MKRKLVKQGAATMMISLPSKWIKENKLGKGDEVDLEEKNNKLIINSAVEKIERQTEITISELTESSIRTLITNTYRLGYNKIKINFKDKSVISIIKDVVNKNLLGFEIIRKTDKTCEIENITEPSKEQFDNIFSKIISNIDDLFLITEKALQKEFSEFEETERKIQQFDNFCRRVITKENMFQLRWAFQSELIHAQREIYHLLRFLSKNKERVDKEVLSLLGDCKQIFIILKQAYAEKNIVLLEKIHGLEKRIIYKDGYSIIKKNPIIVHHIINAARGFYLCSSPLSGLIINKA